MLLRSQSIYISTLSVAYFKLNFSQCLFLAAVVLAALCGCRSGNP